MCTDSLLDPVRVSSRRDDRMSGGERGLGDVDTHSSTSAGNEPHLLFRHDTQSNSVCPKEGDPVYTVNASASLDSSTGDGSGNGGVRRE